MHSITLFVLLASGVSAGVIAERATDLTCADLTVKSNNGDRKVAIVIDSSGSMTYSDPDNLRLAAGRSLNDWLIGSKEATSTKKPDLVTVINFDDVPNLDYPLGDPSGANSSFDGIGADGGTYIAGGVQMAIDQLTTAGSGTTAGRSAIVVFTDGEDSSTSELVDAINNATTLGVRVSFGFLDASSSIQDKDVLFAIGKSGGVYSTITTEDSSNNFINYVILNGLTTQDNPQGNNSTLLSGLATAHFTAGSQTQSVTYNARTHEYIDFTIQSIDAGPLTAQLVFGGSVKNTTSIPDSLPSDLTFTAPNAGQIEIKVTAMNAPTDSLFVVGAVSNMPVQNCTVGIGDVKKGGLSTGSKVGIGLGVPIAIGLLALAGYFLWKYWSKIPGAGKAAVAGPKPVSWDPQPLPPMASVPPVDPGKSGPDDTSHSIRSVSTVSALTDDEDTSDNNPANNHRKFKIKKRKAEQEYHHHHLAPDHPCYLPTCEVNNIQHQCKDEQIRCLCADATTSGSNHKCEEAKIPCACTDQKCPLNDSKHKCQDPERRCECIDVNCPLNEEQKKRERRDTGLRFVVKGANSVGGQIINAM